MFSILEIDDPTWTSRLTSLPREKQDVHFFPNMFMPYVRTYGWAAKAALTVEGDEFIIQPFLLTQDGQIRHAYNFGGPIGTDKAYSLTEAHSANLESWATGLEVPAKASFVTLNPLCYQLELLPLSPERVKDAVYIDLKNMKFRGTTRRLANKAQGAGVTVVGVEVTPKNVQVFNEIYTNTMDRAQAKPYWYTPSNFFLNLLQLTSGQLMFAMYQGEIEAGCVIIPSPNGVCYYHYAGSYNRFPKLGVNHMMVAAAAEYCKNRGYDKLMLGGGLTADPKDPLFIFKSGFSDCRAPVYVYKRELKGA